MRVLLLGNGFDLYYKLPTKYINFLHTVSFLVENYTEEMRTVGDILGHPRLQEVDNWIRDSYEANKAFCDRAVFDQKEVEHLIKLAEGNMWYSYFLRFVGKNITWIDFEKEIGTVLSGIRESFQADCAGRLFSASSLVMEHTLRNFDFYADPVGRHNFKFKLEFLLEEPTGSGNYVIDTKKIIERLSESLDGLAEMLQIYLSQFAESIVKELAKEDRSEDWLAQLRADKVLSFNYTNTYEKLFPGSHVEHIHGTTRREIVLGINPDADDVLDTVDTTFLPFKKYFQRVVRKTDLGYLALVHHIRGEYGPRDKFVALTAMGHSLDVTDKDVIMEMFSLATQIAVIYHDQQALSSYVNKLVQIYGKEEFDLLRLEKDLRFLSIDTDIDRYLYSLDQMDQLALDQLKL